MKQFIVQTGYEGQGWESQQFIAAPFNLVELQRLRDLIDGLEPGGRVIIRRGDDTPSAFESIKAGLEDAIAFARGDTSRGTVRKASSK